MKRTIGSIATRPYLREVRPVSKTLAAVSPGARQCVPEPGAAAGPEQFIFPSSPPTARSVAAKAKPLPPPDSAQVIAPAYASSAPLANYQRHSATGPGMPRSPPARPCSVNNRRRPLSPGPGSKTAPPPRIRMVVSCSGVLWGYDLTGRPALAWLRAILAFAQQLQLIASCFDTYNL